jgi:O-antigen ligase
VGLLYGSMQAVLTFRNLKYPIAMIGAGVLGICFLILPRKFVFLQYMAGFSLPYYIELILKDGRGASVALSGTLLIAILLVVVGLATRSQPLILEPIVLVPAVGFVCAGLLSFLNTTDQTTTLIATWNQAELVLFFLILVNFFRTEEDLVCLLRGLYLGFILQCAIYVLQNFLGFSFDILGNTRYTGATDLEGGRITSQRGTYATSATMAALYFSVVSLSLIGLFLSRRKLPIRLNALIGAGSGVICLILAAKRAPLASFVLGMITIAFLGWKLAPHSRPLLFKVLAGLAFPILLGLPVLLLRAEADHEADYDERANLTKIAFEMFKANPILGIGLGTYDSVKRDYLPPGWSGWLYTVHNRYLSTLAETGIVGVTFYVLRQALVLYAAFRGIFRVFPAFRPYQIGLIAGLVAIAWEMAWDIFLDRQHEYLVWFMTALVMIVPRALSNGRQPGVP